MTVHEIVGARELDARCDDGLDVRLLWQPHGDRVWVGVQDHGDAFTVDVPERERALNAFRHPFAYSVASR